MKIQAEKRKTSKRSEMVSVRFEPKLRYLADLAARKQRRTLSSYVEWAVAESLARVEVFGGQKTIADTADFFWDVNEVHRFLKLAFHLPDLLNHDEQVLWKSLQQNRFLWRGKRDKQGEFYFHPSVGSAILARIEENWPALCATARGNSKPDALPKWEEVVERGLYARNSELDLYFEDQDSAETHLDDIPPKAKVSP